MYSRMTQIKNTENIDIQDMHRNVSDSDPEACVLTQAQVDEQIRNYIVPVSKQLEDLSWLIQRMKKLAHSIFAQWPVPS